MAVTQAVTKYGIRSNHPIFVHWVQDTKKSLKDHTSAGWDDFASTWMHFALFQALVVVAAASAVMMVKSRYV